MTTSYDPVLGSSHRRTETVTTCEQEPNIDAVRIRLLEEEREQLRDQLEALRGEQRETEEKYLQACGERDVAQRERGTFESHVDALQSDCNAQKDLVAQLSKELEEARTSMASKDAKLKDLEAAQLASGEQLERASVLNTELQGEMQRVREENQRLRRDNVQLAKREEDARVAREGAEGDVEETTQRLERLEAELRAKKETARELLGAKISLEQQAERQELKIESLRNELELAAVSHDSLKRQMKEEHAEVKRLKAAAREAEQELSETRDHLDRAQVERDSMQNALHEADENGQRLQAQVEAFRSKLEAMVKRVETYKKQRAMYQKEQQDLLKVLASVHKLVDAAGAHASKCQARGTFALKSRRIHEDLQRVLDGLMDHIIQSSSKLSNRKEILQQLKEMQLF